MIPCGLPPTRLEADRVISTFSFDPNLEPSPQNLRQGEANRPLEPNKRLKHLLGGGLRSSGMPHEGFADPSANDGSGFHTNIPISELIERDTRAVEASVVNSAPLVVETEDRVMRKTWSTPMRPEGAQGLEPLDPRSRDRGSKAGPRRARGHLASNKS